MNNIIAQFILE